MSKEEGEEGQGRRTFLLVRRPEHTNTREREQISVSWGYTGGTQHNDGTPVDMSLSAFGPTCGRISVEPMQEISEPVSP